MLNTQESRVKEDDNATALYPPHPAANLLATSEATWEF